MEERWKAKIRKLLALAQSDNLFEAERARVQANKLFVSATGGRGNVFALPVPIGQTFQLGALALVQLKKQSPIKDGDLLLAALRGADALYSQHKDSHDAS